MSGFLMGKGGGNHNFQLTSKTPPPQKKKKKKTNNDPHFLCVNGRGTTKLTIVYQNK